jgi:hypothetical protein
MFLRYNNTRLLLSTCYKRIWLCVCVFIYIYIFIYLFIYIYTHTSYCQQIWSIFLPFLLSNIPYITNIKSRKLFQYCHLSNKNARYIVRGIWKFVRYSKISTNVLHYFSRTPKRCSEELWLWNTALYTYIWASYITWCFLFTTNNSINDKKFCVHIRQT